uniref:LFA3 protein n=1 Tax=Accipiter nisus TaxID=211598 RepID=A0A8B9M1S8_9AVES
SILLVVTILHCIFFTRPWTGGLIQVNRGKNFTFPVKIDQNIVEIIWTKNKDKVAEWEGQTNPIYFASLQNRSLLNKENGHLTIFNLENNDAGTYVLDCLTSGEKIISLPFTHQTQEIVIPKKNVPASEKAACFIKVSQTEKSSEISLTQCFPDKKGNEWVTLFLELQTTMSPLQRLSVCLIQFLKLFFNF